MNLNFPWFRFANKKERDLKKAEKIAKRIEKVITVDDKLNTVYEKLKKLFPSLPKEDGFSLFCYIFIFKTKFHKIVFKYFDDDYDYSSRPESVEIHEKDADINSSEPLKTLRNFAKRE